MAGSIAVTTTDAGGGITKYSIAWTSDASGNVSANNTFAIKRGHIIQAKFVPVSGVSANYNVTLLDADGVDLLAGKGATLINTAASIVVPAVSSLSPAFTENNAAAALVVSGGGNAAQGRVDIFVGP